MKTTGSRLGAGVAPVDAVEVVETVVVAGASEVALGSGAAPGSHASAHPSESDTTAPTSARIP